MSTSPKYRTYATLWKWNIIFHTCTMHSIRTSASVKHKVHQVQGKQIDSHKICLKTSAFATTQAWKPVGHWSTASSISDCSKLHHTCSRRCRSSSMSWTLLSYTRWRITDKMVQSTGFRSGEFGGHMPGAMKSGMYVRRTPSSSIVPSARWAGALSC